MKAELPSLPPLLDALCATTDIGVAIVGPDLRIVRISRSLADLFDLSSDADLGRSFHELVPALAPAVETTLKKVFATGERVLDLELSATRQGRTCHWIHHFVPLCENDVVGAVAILVTDRTSEHEAKQALRISEAQFRTMCETAPIGIFLTDATGSSLYTNQVNAEQMGISVEDAIGDGWEGALHPEDRETVRKEFYAAMLDRRVYRGVNRYLHADGRVVFVEVKANAIYDAELLLGYVGVAEDISGRRHADAIQRESEMRFRQLAENIESVFWLSSADHQEVLYVSPAFERIWDRPASLLSDIDAFLATVFPEDRHLVIGSMQDTSARFEIEYRIMRPDGTIRWISDRGFPVRDDRGVLVRQAGIATDITRQKMLEAQVRQSQRLDSIGRLAGGIAHDFNNLLAVIQSQTASVSRSVEPGALRDQLREVELAANRAAELTRHLLSFARRQNVQPAVLDLNDVVTGVESLLRRLIGPDVEVVLRLDPDLAIVRADPTQIEQVIVNLIVNAREAMAGGGTLTIATSNRLLDATSATLLGVEPGAYAELSVSDTGQGIREDVLPHLFEPFFTTREAAGGVGLGLSTCYGIVRQSRGSIVADSTLGLGTTFRVMLPRIETI